jgi:hypothetical protein
VTATFGGGWDAALGLLWDELILRYVEAALTWEETWGQLGRRLDR